MGDRSILQFIAFHYHNTVCKFLNQKNEKRVKLSPREKEVLLWTAEGKTAWEISKILNLSISTTNQYIRKAIEKFGVHNKQHALAKAYSSGILIP